MRAQFFGFLVLASLTLSASAYAGDTTTASIECFSTDGLKMKLDYSYLDIKDHELNVELPFYREATPSLRQFWDDGKQLMLSIRLDRSDSTRFLDFKSSSTEVDRLGKKTFTGSADFFSADEKVRQKIKIECKETDGGGSW